MPVQATSKAVLLTACCALAACGTEQASSAPEPSLDVAATTSPTPAPAASTTAPAADASERVLMDPADLVGTWAVTGTDEIEPVTMTLGVYELQIWRACGEQGGEWKASPTGLFDKTSSPL